MTNEQLADLRESIMERIAIMVESGGSTPRNAARQAWWCHRSGPITNDQADRLASGDLGTVARVLRELGV